MTTNDPGPEPEYLGAGRPRRPDDRRRPRRRGSRTPHRAGRGRSRRGRRRGRRRRLRRRPADGRRQLAGDRRPRGRGRLRQPRPRPVGVPEDRGLQDPAQVPGAQEGARQPRRHAPGRLRGDRQGAAAARTSTTPRTSSPGSATASPLAAVPDSKQGALPLVVLQVTDQDEGEGRASATMESCGGADDQEPRAPASRSAATTCWSPRPRRRPTAIAKDVEAATLADSDDFTAATERTGRPRHRHDVRLQGRARRRPDRACATTPAGASRPGPDRPARQVLRGLPGRRRRAAVPRRRGRGGVQRQGPAPGRGRLARRRAARTSARCPARRPRCSRSRSRTAGWTASPRACAAAWAATTTRCSPRASRPPGCSCPRTSRPCSATASACPSTPART